MTDFLTDNPQPEEGVPTDFLLPPAPETQLPPAPETQLPPAPAPETQLPPEDQRLQEAIVRAPQVAPDKASRVYRLQLKTGLPVPLIERNLEQLEEEVRRKDFDPQKFRERSPKLAKWLEQNPNYASLAQKDYDHLSFMEQVMDSLDAAKLRYEGGIKKQRLMMLNFKLVTQGLTPAEQKERAQIKQWEAENADKYQEGFARWVGSAADVVGMNLVQTAEALKYGAAGMTIGAAMGAATGVGAAPTALAGLAVASKAKFVATLYASSVGEAYGDLEPYVESGDIDPTVAKYAALLVGVPFAGLEVLSLGQALKLVPGSDKLLSNFTARTLIPILTRPTMRKALMEFSAKYAGAVGTEATTEALQDLLVSITREMVRDGESHGLTAQDYANALAEGLEAGRATMLLGLFGFGSQMTKTALDIHIAKQNEQVMKSLGDVAHNVQMPPEATAEYVRHLQEGEETNVYVPVEAWDALFQDQAPQAATKVLGSDKAYTEAKQLGGDLVIPLDTYVEKIAGTEAHEKLLPSLRLTPGGLSAKEAEEAIAENIPEQLRQKAEADVQEAIRKETPLDLVYDSLYQQLRNAGVNDQLARQYATLERERVRTRAERLGMDPWELYQSDPLTVKRQEYTTAPTAAQPTLYQDAATRVEEQLALQLEKGMLAPETEERIQNTAQTLAKVHNGLADEGSDVVGATINPHRGDLIGQQAVAVGAVPERAVVVPGKHLDPALVDAFIKHNWDLLGRIPEMSVGSWYDAETDATYLDIVATPEDLQNALRLAQDRGWYPAFYGYAEPWYEEFGGKLQFSEEPGPEKAVFDLKALEEIPVNPPPEQVQLPLPLRPPVEVRGDLVDVEAVRQNPRFQEWFGDSQIVDSWGRPLVLYHQTTSKSRQGIEKRGFDVRQAAARASDEIMPDGVFLKTTATDIGLSGREQIPVFASIKNPLIVQNRQEMLERVTDAKYQELAKKVRQLEEEYQDKFNELDKQWSEARDFAKRDALAYQIDDLLEAWRLDVVKAATEARKRLTAWLEENGYDGVWMKEDEGGFGKRSVETIVALHPEQVKSVFNTGLFGKDTPNILFHQATDTQPAGVAEVQYSIPTEQLELPGIPSANRVKISEKKVRSRKRNVVQVEFDAGIVPPRGNTSRMWVEYDEKAKSAEITKVNIPYDERRQRVAEDLVDSFFDWVEKKGINTLVWDANLAKRVPPEFGNLMALSDGYRYTVIRAYKRPDTGKLTMVAKVLRPQVKFAGPPLEGFRPLPQVRTPEEGTFRVYMPKFRVPHHTEFIGTQFSVITEMRHEDKQAIMTLFDSLRKAGLPESVLAMPKWYALGLFPNPNIMATYNPDTRALTINFITLDALRKGKLTEEQKQSFTLQLLHELGHAVSVFHPVPKLAHVSPLLAFNPYEVDLSYKGKNDFSFYIPEDANVGPVARELLELYNPNSKVPEGLRHYFMYPVATNIVPLLRSAHDSFAAQEMGLVNPDFMSKAIEISQSELFAQAFALYFAYPKLTQEYLPYTYNMMRDVYRSLEHAKDWDDVVDKVATAVQMPGKEEERQALLQKIIEPDRPVLFQGKRGAFLPSSKTIVLFKEADPSTFIHELGHSWLEELRHDAMRPDAPEQVKKDWATIRDYIGAKDETISTEAHEKFAKLAEAYIMEGKAPNTTLRMVFAKLRAWMKRVYRSLTALDVQLTDEVREVFDRMLATDETLKQMQENRPLLPREAMTEEEYKVYQELNQRIKLEAEDTLRAKLMKQLRRQQSAEYQARKKALTKEATEALNEDPVYRALFWLQNGVLPDGKPLPGVEAARLDRETVRAMGVDPDTLPRRTVQARGGVHPDVVAQMFGVTSGRDLVQALSGIPSRREAIQKRVEEQLAVEFNDLTLGNRLAEAAAQEMENRQVELYQMELRLLRRLGARRDMTHPAVLKELAKKMIASRKMRDINPRYFETAARKAGAEAEAALLGKEMQMGLARNLEAAFDAKQRQLLNTYLAQEARRVKDKATKRLRAWRKIFASSKKAQARLAKSRNMDLVNTARAIAAAHELGPPTVKTPAEYLETLKQYDPQTYEDMQAFVTLAASDTRSWKDMTVEEFNTVADVIDGLWHMSRQSKVMEIEGRKVELQQAVSELVQRIDQLSGEEKERRGYHRAVSKQEKVKIGLLGARAALRRVLPWVDAMDGGDPKGAFRRYIWRPIADAADKYRDARADFLQRYLELTKPIEEELKTQTGEIPAPELQYTFKDKTELLGMLLHTGNESNLMKLLVGRGWGTLKEDGQLDTSRFDAFIKRMQEEGVLTKKDYDFVQNVWDLLEELKPLAQKAHKEMYGYYFDEITARPFQTPWGEYRGGYFPAIVDPFVADDAALRADKAALEERPSSFMFPTTGRGFTISRLKRYAKPLSMDLGLVPQHIEQVLRFAYLEPRVKEVGRLVINREFREALSRVDSEVASEMLMPWLQRAARQTVSTPSVSRSGRFVDKFFSEVRTRTGMQIMVANVSNTLQQVTGLSITAVKVKPRYLAGALWRYVRAPRETSAMVDEKSVFMRHHMTAKVMEVSKAIDDILLHPSKYEKARKFAREHGYFMQSATQNIVDIISWLGAYNQAIEQGYTEEEAVRISDDVVRETQGTFNPEDLSRFETGSPFTRAFTMFYSYFNMQANLLGTEFVKTLREKMGFRAAPHLVYVWALGFMIPAVLSEAIVQAMSGELFDDDDDDGYLDNLLEVFFMGQIRTAAGMVPLAGPAVMAGINAFNDKWYDDRITTSPAVSMLESAARAPYGWYRIATGDEVRLKGPIRDTLTLLGMVTGLPLAPLGRPLGYITDVEQGYVEPENALDMTRGLITGRASK